MDKQKQLVLIFNHFEEEHLGKDVFLVPYYLGKQLNMKVMIVYPLTGTNNHFAKEHRGVQLHPLNCFTHGRLFIHFAFCWLLLHIRNIDVLMQFHFSNNTLYLGNLFKLLHPTGKLYIKSDGIYWLDCVLAKQKNGSLKYGLYQNLLKKVDCVSIEPIDGYKRLLNNIYCNISLANKTVLIPNGFDEEFKNVLGIKERSPSEKENLIITVARIGDENKNTKMFMDALETVDLKEWKVYFIGPIMLGFENDIALWYERNIDKKAKVYFIGAIYDKKELWGYYNRAKVFVLTSYSEGFPIALSEAQRFKNYIVTTDIDTSHDFVSDVNKGVVLNKNDVKGLSSVLTNIVEERIDVNHVDAKPLIWSELVTRIKL